MNREDINRTYGETFLGYRTDGGIEPLLVHGGESRNVMRTDRGDIDMSDPNVVFDFPDVGYVQYHDDRAVYLKRRAERQWHRGIRRRAFIGADGLDIRRLVRSMYNPTVHDINSYAERDVSRLSNACAIKRNGVVLLHSLAVGTYSDGALTVKIEQAKAILELEEWANGISINVQS